MSCPAPSGWRVRTPQKSIAADSSHLESQGVSSQWLPSGNLLLYCLLLKMAIEIVDLPIKNGDFPYSHVSLPKGI